MLVLVAAVGLGGGGPDSGREWLVFVAVLVGIGGPLAAIVLAMGRPRLGLDDDGITVRNYASTRRLAWTDVESFALQRGDPCLVANVTDGRKPVPIHAVRYNPRHRGQVVRTEAIREELNGILAERR